MHAPQIIIARATGPSDEGIELKIENASAPIDSEHMDAIEQGLAAHFEDHFGYAPSASVITELPGLPDPEAVEAGS